MSATEILEQFRKLSREQQRELLERIREEVGDLDDELTLEQLAELERRAEEFRKDPHLGIPWEQVRDEVRKAGFVLDHASAIGEVIVTSPTQQSVRADFHGVEAHAGIRPEDGSNAIAAAATAISRMELGRLDEETTANVGVIEGGTSGNVVPGHCSIVAEARSLDAGRAAEVAGSLSDACAWGASEHGCDADVRIEELFRGYRIAPTSPALALAEAGLRRAGFESDQAPLLQRVSGQHGAHEGRWRPQGRNGRPVSRRSGAA